MNISRFLILPYCLIYGLSDDYLDNFYPESDTSEYVNFGDFFKRKMKSLPSEDARFIWPCEGYVCDWGQMKDKTITTVKAQKISPQMIFQSDTQIPASYFFTNIFLHNHNYHRIHAPISGRVTSIKRISGSLSFLRPWFYKKEAVSFPALKNERLNIEITDIKNQVWYLSMVGGFGVGTIKIPEFMKINTEVSIGQEIGWFELGSTVCMATPESIEVDNYLQLIKVGTKIKTRQI